MNERRNGELTRGAAQHAEALSESYRRRERTRGKAVRGEIHRADEPTRRSRALQQAADLRGLHAAKAEQCRPDGNENDAGRNDGLAAEPIEQRTANDREQRIGVVVKADERAHAQRVAGERRTQLGNHHARRGTQHVLHEVERGTEKPGDDETHVYGRAV